MADTASSGGAAPAPATGGSNFTGGTPAAPASPGRARIGDFSAFTAGVELSHQGAPQPQTIEAGEDPNDPFSPLAGVDAQAQALTVEDSSQAEVMSEDETERWKKAWEEREAWAKADDLPEPFAAKLYTVTIDGERYRVPVSELARGYQRDRDYSNKMRDLSQRAQVVLQREAGLQNWLQQLDDGQRFLDAMVTLNKFKGFHEAALIYGRQLDAESRMTAEQRQVLAHNRALAAHNQRLQLELRTAQAVAQQQVVQRPNETEERYMHQCAQLIPKAAQQVGWVDSELSRRYFEAHFANMLPSLNGQDLSSDFLMSVMRAAQQDMDAAIADSQARMQRERPAMPPQQLPPPAQRGSAQPNPAAVNGQPQTNVRRSRIGDFSTQVMRR